MNDGTTFSCVPWRPDVIAILYASAGMILLPHTDVLEAAVRKLLDKIHRCVCHGNDRHVLIGCVPDGRFFRCMKKAPCLAEQVISDGFAAAGSQRRTRMRH